MKQKVWEESSKLPQWGPVLSPESYSIFLIHTLNLKYNFTNLFFSENDVNTICGLNLEFANFGESRAPRVLIKGRLQQKN